MCRKFVFLFCLLQWHDTGCRASPTSHEAFQSFPPCVSDDTMGVVRCAKYTSTEANCAGREMLSLNTTTILIASKSRWS